MVKDEMINYGTQIIAQTISKTDVIKFNDIGLREISQIIEDMNKGIMEALYNANYRKVADDEIVVKKQAYEKFIEDFAKQEEISHSYEQGYTELLETNHQLQDELEKSKKEKKEILQMIYDKGNDTGIICLPAFAINQLAKAYHIELE